MKAIVFLDLQEEIIKNARTVSVARLTATAGALAKLAALHDLTAFASAVPPGGAYMPSVLAALPDLEPRNRVQTSAFADEGLVHGLRAANATAVVLCGVAAEIVVTRTALDLLAAGFAVELAVDAIGGINARTEDAAFRRIVAQGGVTTSVITLAAEMAGDFTTPVGGETLGIAYAAIAAAQT